MKPEQVFEFIKKGGEQPAVMSDAVAHRARINNLHAREATELERKLYWFQRNGQKILWRTRCRQLLDDLHHIAEAATAWAPTLSA